MSKAQLGFTGMSEEPSLLGARVAILNFREPQQSVAGGAEEYAWRVARHLVSEGVQVTFATSRERGQARSELRDGIALHRMGNRYLIYPLVALWLLLRRRRFDVVVDCMNGIPFFAPAFVSRRTRVISLIHHVHDRQFYAFFPRWAARVGCFVEGPVASRLYGKCSTVTVSESSKVEIRERLKWVGPIQVIPNGSRPAGCGPAPAENSGHPSLVFLGRLVGHKRVSRVVELAELLADRRPGIRVHIVGRGPEFAPLAAMVRERGLEDQVVLHGFLGEEEKTTVLASADLHVTASKFEGWGLTVIEAAAYGVPTVAYDVAGLRDSVRDCVTGWLVHEEECLADVVDRALKRLSDPADRAEMSEACRAWARSFTWERTGASMASLVLDELAAGASRGRVLVPEARVLPEIV